MGPDLQMAGTSGRLVIGTGESPGVREFDGTGALTRIVRWAESPRPVDAAMEQAWKDHQSASMEDGMSGLPAEVRAEALDKLRNSQETIPFPATLPAHLDLRLDPSGHLWVRRYRTGIGDPTPTSWQGKEVGPEAAAEERPTAWWVFDLAGVWLGEVATPPGLRVEVVTEDAVWGVHRDGLGVETVRSYALERGG